MKFARKRLTYANVMSSLAVFLVLAGGTAFAASQLGKETVGARQLKKEAVTPAKLSTAAKVTLTGPAGPVGPKGEKGEKGERGEKGEKGTAGTTSIHEVVNSQAVSPNSTGEAQANCPAGQVATGGGAFNQTSPTATIFQDGPIPNPVSSGSVPTGWKVYYKSGSEAFTEFVFVLCATP